MQKPSENRASTVADDIAGGRIRAAKVTLRCAMRGVRRDAFSGSQRSHAEALCCTRLVRVIEDLELPATSGIAVFLAQGTELNLDPVAEALFAQGYTVVAPVIGADHRAPFHSLHSLKTGLRQSAQRVREPDPNSGGAYYAPEQLRLVLVPGLAFDAGGGRLGYGGGWYDRVLAQASLSIGVCFDCQLVESVPREAHDQRVDGVVTEQRTVDASGRLGLKTASRTMHYEHS